MQAVMQDRWSASFNTSYVMLPVGLFFQLALGLSMSIRGLFEHGTRLLYKREYRKLPELNVKRCQVRPVPSPVLLPKR